jgi:hypothetical protein
MWVATRVALFVIAYAWRVWRRTGGPRPLDPSGSGVAVLHKGRRSRTRLLFGVRYAHPLFFSITREGNWDRLFKAFGLSVEAQTGDPAFDQRVYVACDQPELRQVLVNDQSARAAVLALMESGVHRIFTDGAKLWATSSTRDEPSQSQTENLCVLRLALEKLPGPVTADPFFWRALAIESAIWSCVWYLVPSVLERVFHGNSVYLNGQVWTMALAASCAAFALLLVTLAVALRGSSRRHRILVDNGVLLLLLVAPAAAQVASDVNIGLDPSPPYTLQAHVSEKRRHLTTRRSWTSPYSLRLRWSDPDSSLPSEIHVGGRVYDSARPDGVVLLTVHPGLLGAPWIERIETD